MVNKDINKWLEQARARGLSDMEIQTKLKSQGLNNKQINQVLVGAYHDKKIILNQKNKKQINSDKKNIKNINKLTKSLKISNIIIIFALLFTIIFGIFLPNNCHDQCLIYFFPSVILFIIADIFFIISLIKYRKDIKQLLQTTKGWLLILPCSIHIIYIIINFLN